MCSLPWWPKSSPGSLPLPPPSGDDGGIGPSSASAVSFAEFPGPFGPLLFGPFSFFGLLLAGPSPFGEFGPPESPVPESSFPDPSFLGSISESP